MDTLPREIIQIILSQIPTDELVTKFRAVNKQFFGLSKEIVTEIGPSFKREQTHTDNQIWTLARDYSHIKAMDLSQWTSVSEEAFAIALTKFPQLKSLVLPLFGREWTKVFSKHVVPSVTFLDMSAWSPDPRTNFPTNLIKTFPNVQHLILPNIDITMLKNILNSATSLTSLEVKGHKSHQILNFADLPNLKQLTINGYYGTTLSIRQCPSLETLTIRFSVLTSWDFLKEIPKVQNLTLHKFFFDSWDVTGVTANTDLLVKILMEHCRDIKTLKIYRLKITVDQLEKIVYSLPNLRKLILFQTEDKLLFAAKKLQEAKPTLRIVVPEVKYVYVDPAVEVYAEESDQIVQCQHCLQDHKKCDTRDHEEVCLQWPGWRCMFNHAGCSKSGMNKEQLRLHLEKCDYNVIRCPVLACSEFIRRHELDSHKAKHVVTYGYPLKATRACCPNVIRGCTTMFANKSELINHMSKCQKSHVLCLSCQQPFDSREDCMKHMTSDCQGPVKRVVIDDSVKELVISQAEKFSDLNKTKNFDTDGLVSSYYFGLRSSYG